MPLWYPFLEPRLTTYISNISVQSRPTTELGTSTSKKYMSILVISWTVFGIYAAVLHNLPKVDVPNLVTYLCWAPIFE